MVKSGKQEQMRESIEYSGHFSQFVIKSICSYFPDFIVIFIVILIITLLSSL